MAALRASQLGTVEKAGSKIAYRTEACISPSTLQMDSLEKEVIESLCVSVARAGAQEGGAWKGGGSESGQMC